MSVTFDDVGTITIHTTPPVVLRRPTYGEYRKARDKHKANVKRVDEALAKAADIAAHPENYDDDEARSTLDELNGFLEVWHHDWVADAAVVLGDRPLPEPDDWPADLALDPVVPVRMLEHWRRVPLAHGGPENGSRSKTGNG